MSIHDQNYVRYEGSLREGAAWWIIAMSSLRLYWSFLRTKLVLLLLWIFPLVMGVLIVVEYAVRQQMAQMAGDFEPMSGAIAFFMQMEIFALALLFVASGCGAISDDLRHRTFQLYFSKPLSRWEYGVGKFLGLFFLGSLVTVAPALLLGLLRTAFYFQTDHLATIAKWGSLTVLLSVGLTAIVCLVVLGLSSLTRRTGYVVLAFIGVLLVPLILHGIVAVATGGEDYALLWSLPGNVVLITETVLGIGSEEGRNIPVWAPFAVVAVLGAAGLGSLVRRVTRLEGVA
ncbi:MAG: ABC transporter permease [Bradymonadaceae bacterium]